MDREAIYKKYLELFKASLIENYQRLGLKASGEYEQSLYYTIEKNKLTMFGAKHSVFMELGRGSGKFPPIKAIEDWIDVKKGLPSAFYEKKKQFAFIIARKIANEGITVPNQYNKGKAVSFPVELFLGETIYRMFEEIGDAYMRQFDFESDFRNILQAA